MVITLEVNRYAGVWTTRCPSTPHTYAVCGYRRPCECRYYEGKEPAHYPVPALITEVSMWPTHVAVCVLSNVPGSAHDICGDGWEVYHYGY